MARTGKHLRQSSTDGFPGDAEGWLKFARCELVVVKTYPTVRFSPAVLQLPGHRNEEKGQVGSTFPLMNMTKAET